MGEPESRGSYLKKYTVFLVSSTFADRWSQLQTHHVRRRYSDFVWLRAVLHARYIGLLVPSLPEKTATAAVLKGDAFLQSRSRGLFLFLSAVVASPYLRSDAAVESFLTVADDNEWETSKKETHVMENAGVGHLRWLHRIVSEPIASSPEECDRLPAGFPGLD